MGTTVLFVHGTGVREDSFKASFELIRNKITGAGTSGAEPCFWGGTEGARLLADGASIPDYQATGGGDADSDEELARWTILYADPWYELRLLGDAQFEQGEIGFGQTPPDELLSLQIREHEPSDEFTKLIEGAQLGKFWPVAQSTLVTCSPFQRAIATVGDDPRTHRKIIARALVAKMLALAEEAQQPSVSGATRDALVEQLGSDLDAYGLGVGEWLTKPFVGLGKRWATRKLRRQRGAITDAAMAMPADILVYQTRGQPIRDFIRQAVNDAAGDDVTLLAHSLGGIASVDLLVSDTPQKVKRLITVGSQSPFMYELNCLSSLRYGDALPNSFPPWLNIYDPKDVLSYVGEEVFAGRVTDVEVDNGQPFPESHSAYWSNPEVWNAIKDFVDG